MIQQLVRVDLPEGDVDAAFFEAAVFLKGAGAGFGDAVEGLAVGSAEDDKVTGEQSDVVPGFVAVLSTTDAKDDFITNRQRHNRGECGFVGILVHAHGGAGWVEVNQRHIGMVVGGPGLKLFGDIGSRAQSAVSNVQQILRHWRTLVSPIRST